MKTPRRTSLASRLAVGALVITVALVASVSAFMLVSRNLQIAGAAQSDSTNHALAARELLEHVSEQQLKFAALDLASLDQVRTALSGTQASTGIDQLFAQHQAQPVPSSWTVIFDAHGQAVYTNECDATLPDGSVRHPAVSACEAQTTGAHVLKSTSSVALVLGELGNSRCQVAARPASCPAGYDGIEVIGSGRTLEPAYDAAIPVWSSTGTPLGTVVYGASLQSQFAKVGGVLAYSPLFVPSDGSGHEFLYDNTTTDYHPSVATAPAAMSDAQTKSSYDSTRQLVATYSGAGGTSTVTTLVELGAPDATSVAGWVGVAEPVSVFAGATSSDTGEIVAIGATAVLVVFLLVLLFVRRFVWRPIAELESGVARIAGGDYGTDIPVTRHDELGRLAGSVNVMRSQIADYIKHVDDSVDRLRSVSHALTTTTSGVGSLQQAVLHAAAAMGGEDALAVLLSHHDDSLVPSTSSTGRAVPLGLPSDHVRRILAGECLRDEVDGRHLLVTPMRYRDSIAGAIAVLAPRPPSEIDERALTALANNAAVAMENTRLFEQERQTVQKLRELDAVKTDFLATAQHELRTPVLAIQGQLQLLQLAWEQWDDASKFDVIQDIDISTRMLNELVETIISFSLLSAETIDLKIGAVNVAKAVADAIGEVSAHFKVGLPVEVDQAVDEGVWVAADPARLSQVLRAVVDNAVKFTPTGGHVSVVVRESFGKARVDIFDDGIGIDAENLPKIFDRFFQVDASKTRKYGGMGMGLALAKRLCEAHGGAITVESNPGEGSCFTITWPIAAQEMIDSAATQPAGFHVIRT